MMKVKRFTVRIPQYLMHEIRKKAKETKMSINTCFLVLAAEWLEKRGQNE